MYGDASAKEIAVNENAQGGSLKVKRQLSLEEKLPGCQKIAQKKERKARSCKDKQHRINNLHSH